MDVQGEALLAGQRGTWVSLLQVVNVTHADNPSEAVIPESKYRCKNTCIHKAKKIRITSSKAEAMGCLCKLKAIRTGKTGIDAKLNDDQGNGNGIGIGIGIGIAMSKNRALKTKCPKRVSSSCCKQESESFHSPRTVG